MSNENPSITKLENDIVTTRDRLAQTIDELSVRAAPKNVAARQKESLKASFDGAALLARGRERGFEDDIGAFGRGLEEGDDLLVGLLGC